MFGVKILVAVLERLHGRLIPQAEALLISFVMPSSLVAPGVMVRMLALGPRTGAALRRSRSTASRVVASVTTCYLTKAAKASLYKILCNQ